MDEGGEGGMHEGRDAGWMDEQEGGAGGTDGQEEDISEVEEEYGDGEDG